MKFAILDPGRHLESNIFDSFSFVISKNLVLRTMKISSKVPKNIVVIFEAFQASHKKAVYHAISIQVQIYIQRSHIHTHSHTSNDILHSGLYEVIITANVNTIYLVD
jgi:hypothetical protein